MPPDDDFQKIARGEKKMVSYYKADCESSYHTDTSRFDELVKKIKMKRMLFTVKNEKQNFKINYKTYALPVNLWRLNLYKAIKKIGQREWNEDLEAIERLLLGSDQD